MWLQVVGKLRLAAAPMVNHWWQATFYVTPRRLTTGSIPHGSRTFSVELDFHDHVLLVSSDDGRRGSVALEPKSVATFYGETMAALGDLGIETTISASPNEVDPAIPFAEDETHASYDASAAHLFWRQLVQVERVMRQSAVASRARSAPCISSGARWTSRAHGFRAAPRWSTSRWRAPGPRDRTSAAAVAGARDRPARHVALISRLSTATAGTRTA